MTGIHDLQALLRGMQPVLSAEEYGFGRGQEPGGLRAFAVIREAEGVTLVAPVADLAAAGVVHEGGWARISLTVHSDLAAVGLTAAISAALAAEGISANVIAGYFHDHILVPWARREAALAALARLAL